MGLCVDFLCILECVIKVNIIGRRTKMPLVRIEIIKELYEKLEIQASDVFIVINEPPNENRGLAGKQR